LNRFDEGVELRKLQVVGFVLCEAIKHQSQFIFFGIDTEVPKEMCEIVEADVALSSAVKHSERVIDIEIFALRQFDLDLFDFSLIFNKIFQKLVKELKLIGMLI
jgi:hypothetical protein